MNAPDPRREYFGTVLNPCSFQQWLAAIGTDLESGKRRHLSAHHNLHSLHLLHRNNSIAEFYRRSDDCYIDGMPVRLILAGFGEHTTSAQRFSPMDHFRELLAHAQAQPPRWMSRVGLAWLYRLAKDPARLWRRYLVEPWILLPPMLRQWYRHRAAGRARV
jgi:UDP-N-acetyl-D-mannosaminuronic acid transferase (WecB/TagA/CpsF family)